ncbi:copper resistance protein CopC [Lentzea sp. NPDC058436]|uniref:copper resistance CopC family protein n=1 Tax=Lentzea sp. NPDC058436 TaxID=3346499 RepID=UPI00365298BB
MTRYFSALVLALLTATAFVVPAQAHAELKSSNPASGATLEAPPKTIELVFSESISLPDGDAITITGADGAKVPVTQANAVDSTITATLDTSAAKSGVHTVDWSAKSADGDTVTGKFTFTMTVPAPTSSAAAPTTTTTSAPASTTPPSAAPDESGGVPIWVWLLIALVVVVGVILLVRRRKPAETP